MKKSLFVLGVAVAALASCTNEEVVNIADSNAISFDAAFVGKATKVTAPETTTDNITDIYVYAQKATDAVAGTATPVFANTRVYKNTAGEWDYDNHQLWDKESETNYKFAAYSGKELVNTTNVSFDWSTGLLSFTDIVIDGTPANQYDLLAVNAPTTVNSTSLTVDSKVSFSLNHVLSMVQFTLKSGFGAETTVEVSDFRFYGMKTKGDGSFSTNAWNWTTEGNDVEEATTSFANSEVEEAVGAPASGEGSATDVINSWIVIPQAIQGASAGEAKPMVSFTATVKGTVDGTEDQVMATKKITAQLPAITWVAGYRYNYNMVIDIDIMDMVEEYITFDKPSVIGWGDWQDGGESGMASEDVEP